MLITRFRVKGFRSLEDVVLEDLDGYNVFYGANGVGKSNIMRAMALFGRLVASSEGNGIQKSGSQYSESFHNIHVGGKIIKDDYTWGSPRRIEIKATLASFEGSPVEIRIVINPLNQPPMEIDWGTLPPEEIQVVKSSIRSHGCFRIPSSRRLEREVLQPDKDSKQSAKESELDSVGGNLKRMLFWASVSPSQSIKARFWERLVPLLRDEPLSLGDPTAVAASASDVDVHFTHKGREISVGDLGSGVQQLLLMLGLICLSDAQLIALEEPEMNLSWATQRSLDTLLKKLVEKTADSNNSPPHQLFISSHSPLFAPERYYDVRLEKGRTVVVRRPRDELPYFDGVDLPLAPDARGSRLLWRNLVRIPDEVVARLSLEPGQLVFFKQRGDSIELLNEEGFDKYVEIDEPDPEHGR